VDIVHYWHRLCVLVVRARFVRSERGATIVEYAFLVALIAIVCILAVTFLGTSTSQRYSSVGSALS
jgi:pilus assembly protein Flp/PilA